MKSRPGKYLLFVTSELILVILGILIALQIDGYVQRKKERESEKMYLRELLYDIQQDTGYYGQSKRATFARSIKTMRAFEQITAKQSLRDTLTFINDFKSAYSFVESSATPVTWQDLVNNGRTALIQNRELQKSIARYYASREVFSKFVLEPFNRQLERAQDFDKHLFHPVDQKDFFWDLKQDTLQYGEVLKDIRTVESQNLLKEIMVANRVYSLNLQTVIVSALELLTALQQELAQLE